MLFLAMAAALLASILLTPLVIKLAFRIGAVDKPNYRKVHASVMPRIGGLAIFGAFLIGYAVLLPTDEHAAGILIGAVIIIVMGFLDDMLEITAKAKLAGQLVQPRREFLHPAQRRWLGGRPLRTDRSASGRQRRHSPLPLPRGARQ